MTIPLEAFWAATGIVALAEIGDKTQLLALTLAARFRAPTPIIAGILVSTVLNHACAGLLGAWISSVLDPVWLRWILLLSFLAMAVWMLIPDKLDDDLNPQRMMKSTGSVFLTTAVLFFLAEIGDKTQVATVMLATRYDSLLQVVTGTTLGMMLANVPAVYLGDKVAEKLPVKLIHVIAAGIFVVLAMALLAGPWVQGKGNIF